MSSERDKMMGITNYLDFVMSEQPYRKVEKWDRNNARAELAQLRVQAAELAAARTAIEQAREILEDRTIGGHFLNCPCRWCERIGAWLAAHPAPPAEQEQTK